MRTRASTKRSAEGPTRENQPEVDQVIIERPQKRARRKGPSQPVRGGWDELPHNLGNSGLAPKIIVPQVAHEDHEPNNSGPRLLPNSDNVSKSAVSDSQINGEAGLNTTPEKQPRLDIDPESGLPSPPLGANDKQDEKALVPKRIRRKTKDNPYGLMFGQTPFPYWQGPTIEACEEVHRLLTELHGKVKAPATIPPPSLTVAGCGEVPSVLDALMRTLLSAATTMVAANEAFTALVNKYGTVRCGVGKGSVRWNKVRLAPVEELTDTIKRGGLANSKAADIKKILDMVWTERRTLSLDHLHGKTAQQAMSELVRYPRIGVKTAACVILFCLRVPCFAVDTHVHRFCKWLKWVPGTASAEMTFWHCEYLVPDHLKYALHQLFIRHGQTCDRCRAATAEGTEAWNSSSCVLEHLLERNKTPRKGKLGHKVKEEEESFKGNVEGKKLDQVEGKKNQANKETRLAE
ncbi:uncharacterized protein DNG_02908 [Cephalotrichum gorgonifer]|uniref:HhH-GPD domain-containing protein n=1 Tax=Cephalotrichum gorgonifer TaxID=2041049 RepID=A0AAE8ST30_9PEZI|nr:uncharacterized protein DNG_02908 [Cephalotrichum gorgonifer]